MDPLSIIASISGVATAGTSLSTVVYCFISSSPNALDEMVEIARKIGDLSCILSELRRALHESSELCSRALLKSIKSAMKRISRIHDDTYKLMDSIESFETLGKSFRVFEVQYMLRIIESHKTAIQLMLSILILAAATRKEVRSSTAEVNSNDEQKRGEESPEIPVLRQQSGNLIYGACYCLDDLSNYQELETNGSVDKDVDDLEVEMNENDTQYRIRQSKPGPNGTGQWLFDLVFDVDPFHASSKSEALSMRTPTEFRIIACKPGAGDSIIDELLADWTELSRYEISKSRPVSPQRESNWSPLRAIQVLYLKGSSGGQCRFSFELVKTWEDMASKLRLVVYGEDPEAVINIRNGWFTLRNSDREILPPHHWERDVRPGMTVYINLWPVQAVGGVI